MSSPGWSEAASPIPEVRIVTTQNRAVISGTFAATGSRRAILARRPDPATPRVRRRGGRAPRPGAAPSRIDRRSAEPEADDLSARSAERSLRTGSGERGHQVRPGGMMTVRPGRPVRVRAPMTGSHRRTRMGTRGGSAVLPRVRVAAQRSSAARRTAARDGREAVLATALLAFSAVLVWISTTVEPPAVDVALAAAFRALRGPVVTPLTGAITFLGSSSFLVPASLVLAGLLGWRDRGWRRAAAVIVTMAGSLVLTVVVKNAVGRLRPPAADVVGRVSTGYAFPSGHTLNSAVFAGLLCPVVLAASRPGLGWRLLAVAGPIALALAVGLSRIVLGYHWPTDVLGGWLLAAAWLAAARWFTGRRSAPADPAHPELPPAAAPRADGPAVVREPKAGPHQPNEPHDEGFHLTSGQRRT